MACLTTTTPRRPNHNALDGQTGLVLVCHCKPVACLALAAAHAMRASQGKAACMCGCQSKTALQSYPGNDEVSSIPEGDSVKTWREAEAFLRGACSYGTKLMLYASLQTAAHVFPEKWDFAALGAWECSFCEKSVWTSQA
eukprot:6020347-Pleurochrysis_carterae.AAC.2